MLRILIALSLLLTPSLAHAADCPPGTPGYLCVEPRELWESGIRWRDKAQACWEDLADDRVDLAEQRAKLAVRTGTAAVTIPSAEPAGVDPWLVVTIGVAALGAGIILGIVASGDKDTQVLILDRLDQLLE